MVSAGNIMSVRPLFVMETGVFRRDRQHKSAASLRDFISCFNNVVPIGPNRFIFLVSHKCMSVHKQKPSGR